MCQTSVVVVNFYNFLKMSVLSEQSEWIKTIKFRARKPKQFAKNGYKMSQSWVELQEVSQQVTFFTFNIVIWPFDFVKIFIKAALNSHLEQL